MSLSIFKRHKIALKYINFVPHSFKVQQRYKFVPKKRITSQNKQYLCNKKKALKLGLNNSFL